LDRLIHFIAMLFIFWLFFNSHAMFLLARHIIGHGHVLHMFFWQSGHYSPNLAILLHITDRMAKYIFNCQYGRTLPITTYSGLNFRHSCSSGRFVHIFSHNGDYLRQTNDYCPIFGYTCRKFWPAWRLHCPCWLSIDVSGQIC
jgi:hypothetical protein